MFFAIFKYGKSENIHYQRIPNFVTPPSPGPALWADGAGPTFSRIILWEETDEKLDGKDI